ncbi:MAG TPA: hypothetical protein VLB29_05825 [Nocardioidaceae bacterium]|nr:hypothetical protein [Nocardioidaceae bacterium]
MTHTPDEPHDPDEGSSSAGDPGAGRKLDEDAAWREIVENYGEQPEVSSEADEGPSTPAGPSGPSGPAAASDADRDERLRGLFQPSWDDPLDTPATWEDEGHFVPPTPPPVPQVTDPRRRAAWVGLFGSPFVMLVAVVLGWRLPDWLMLGLAGGFVGGFVYLIATMPNRRPGDGSGDDGAVV